MNTKTSIRTSHTDSLRHLIQTLGIEAMPGRKRVEAYTRFEQARASAGRIMPCDQRAELA